MLISFYTFVFYSFIGAVGIFCSPTYPAYELSSKPVPAYIPVTFETLKAWDRQNDNELRKLLLMSCELLLRKKQFPKHSILGDRRLWKIMHKRLIRLPNKKIKAFIKNNFQIYQLNPDRKGLFTGYFTPLYQGRSNKEDGFQTPILRPSILNAFITKNDSRKLIEEKLRINELNSDHVLAWLKSKDDLFFLQIQGSGVIQLKNKKLFAGYGDSNNHPYTSIGTVLLKNKKLSNISLQSLRKWLDENPNEKDWLLNHNARYIFFNETKQIAITASQIPAIPFKTLAVDPEYIPIGSLVWVETIITQTSVPFQQLLLAHDTGTAIKGPVRADIYMGMGEDAARTAGLQKENGKLFMLTLKRKHGQK